MVIFWVHVLFLVTTRALSRSGSGLTLHSNLTISLYNSLYKDNKAALPFALPFFTNIYVDATTQT